MKSASIHFSDDTRGKILQCAFQLMAKKGINEVSVREIVKSAGVSKPALYYYFKDKQDLCRKLFIEGYRKFMDVATIAQDSTNAKDFVRAVIDRTSENIRQVPELAGLVTYLIASPGKKSGLKEIVSEIRIMRKQEILSFFKKAEKRCEIPKNSFDYAMQMLEAVCMRVLIDSYHGNTKCFDKKFSAKTANIIIEGLNAGYAK